MTGNMINHYKDKCKKLKSIIYADERYSVRK